MKPEIEVVTAASRMSAPVRPTKTRSASPTRPGSLPVERVDDARRAAPRATRSPSAVVPFSAGNAPRARRPRSATVISDDEPDRREEAARQRPARARASPRRGWRPSRGPCTRASRAAARTRGRPRSATLPRSMPCVERVRREEQREAEDDEQQLRRQVEHRRRRARPRGAASGGRAGPPRSRAITRDARRRRPRATRASASTPSAAPR